MRKVEKKQWRGRQGCLCDDTAAQYDRASGPSPRKSEARARLVQCAGWLLGPMFCRCLWGPGPAECKSRPLCAAASLSLARARHCGLHTCAHPLAAPVASVVAASVVAARVVAASVVAAAAAAGGGAAAG